MKKDTAIIYILIIIVVLAFTACKKNMEDCEPTTPGKPPVDSAATCRIEQISGRGDEDDYLIANFQYNGHNNPVSVKYVDNLDYSRFFKYDDKQRLIGYERTSNYADSTSFITWHKYVYVSDSLIVDSVFNYGTGWPGDRPTTYGSVNLIEYQLDNKGRVVAKKDYKPDGTFTTQQYEYNLAGNQPSGYPPTYPYLLGVKNIRKTNKVWQFLDLNYSENPLAIETGAVNEQGYPTSWYLDAGVQPLLGFAPNGEPAYITYACKEINPGSK
ncbi:hypothetical protein QTN47_15020 [Danxiaibacter flavus]|uniref:YD repeat-containing protein n=1 Tax=Danxiaibacter flavus TaxID=3049108 RepID=A0ABV3ZG11_9BACT|nr:hypothetical protein QNM32_15030 [Chitinophagaceae bacterium DXS]